MVGLTPGVTYTVSLAACNNMTGLGQSVLDCSGCGSMTEHVGPFTMDATEPVTPFVPTMTSKVAISCPPVYELMSV